MRKNRKRVLIFCVWLLVVIPIGCKEKKSTFFTGNPFRSGTADPHPIGKTFLVLGDSRSGDAVYKDIVASIVSSLPYAAFMIHTGDMIVNAGNAEQWKNFVTMTAPLAAMMPWYGAAGNHDVNSASSQQMYRDVLNFPGNELYYSFDTLQSHFIILDTEIPGQIGDITGEQFDWLKQDLQAHAPSAQYIFVVTHRPPFPQGEYTGRNIKHADQLHELFKQYRVSVVFSGHEHQYYSFQKDSVRYVVTGGGGAPMYEGGVGECFYHYLLVELLPPQKILLHVLDTHGKIIQTDEITLP